MTPYFTFSTKISLSDDFKPGMGNALQLENVATQLGFRSFGQLQTVVIRVPRSNTKADLFCTKVLYRQKFSDDFVQQ